MAQAPPDLDLINNQLLQLQMLYQASVNGTLTPDQITQLTSVRNQLQGWANSTDPTTQANLRQAFTARGWNPDQSLEQLRGTPATNTKTNTNGTTITGSGPNGQMTPQDVQNIINRALGGGGGGGSTLNINRTVAERTASEQNTTGVSTTYVPIPTAAEFLDNFQNDFTMHVQGLLQSGAITAEAADFAQQNWGQFYGSYMRQQVSDLMKGKPLFRVSGLNPDNKLLGYRAGPESSTVSNTKMNQGFNLSDVNTGTMGDAAASQLQANDLGVMLGLQNAPQAMPGGASGAFLSGKGASSGFNISEKATSDLQQKQNQSMLEKLVSQNKLGVVANLAPLDYLKTGATAQQINMMYAGQKGRATREAQTATGLAASQAVRRVA